MKKINFNKIKNLKNKYLLLFSVFTILVAVAIFVVSPGKTASSYTNITSAIGSSNGAYFTNKSLPGKKDYFNTSFYEGNDDGDPYLVFDDSTSTYYLYVTGNVFYTSTDLTNWEKSYYDSLQNVPSSVYGKWYWSPEVYKIGDTYYIFQSSIIEGDHYPTAYNAYAYTIIGKSTDLSKGFTYLQTLNLPVSSSLANGNLIDSNIMIDADKEGALYKDSSYYYFYYKLEYDQNIYGIRLTYNKNSSTPFTTYGSPQLIIDKQNYSNLNSYAWGNDVAEGPQAYKLKDYYHMLYSSGNYKGNDGYRTAYALGYAWSTTPLSSWTNQSEEYSKPFYYGASDYGISNGLYYGINNNSIYAPGHNSILVKTNQEMYNVYHSAYYKNNTFSNRHVNIQRMGYSYAGVSYSNAPSYDIQPLISGTKKNGVYYYQLNDIDNSTDYDGCKNCQADNFSLNVNDNSTYSQILTDGAMYGAMSSDLNFRAASVSLSEFKITLPGYYNISDLWIASNGNALTTNATVYINNKYSFNVTLSSCEGASTYKKIQFPYMSAIPEGIKTIRVVFDSTVSLTEITPIRICKTQYCTDERLNDYVSLTAKEAVYTGSSIPANTATVSSNRMPTYVYYDSYSNCQSATNGTSTPPTNAGYYYVRAYTPQDDNFNAGSSGCIPHVINRSIIAGYGNIRNKIYDGTTAATYDYISFYSQNGGATQPSISVNCQFASKNVGTNQATCTITLMGSSTLNYQLSTNNYSRTATISKATPTVSLAAKTSVYNYTPIKANNATVTLVNNEVYDGTITYKYYTDSNSCQNDSNGTTVAPTDAGTYYARAFTEELSNYNASSSSCVEHIINKRELTIKNVTAYSKVYDGYKNTSCSFTFNNIADYDGIGIVSQTGLFSDANVGTNKQVVCTVELFSSTLKNYNLSNNTAVTTANIYSRAPGITLTPVNTQYTGSEVHANNAQISLVNNETYSGVISYVYYSDSSCTQVINVPKNAGNYYIKAYASATQNYSGTNSACTPHTITKRSLSIKEVTADNKPYDGTTSATCHITFDNVVNNEEITYSVNANFSDKNVGNSKSVSCNNIKLTGVSNTNYSLSETSKTTTANIYKQSPKVTLNPKRGNELLFTGDPIEANKAIIELANGEKYVGTITYKYYTNNICTEGESLQPPTSLGSHFVQATIEETDNYTAAKSPCINHYITDTSVSDIVTLTAKTGLVYNGRSQPANEASTLSNSTVTYTYYTNNTCTNGATTTAPKNAGNYWVRASTDNTSAYLGSSSPCVLHSIAKKEITPVAEVEDKIYDGTTKATCIITFNNAAENEKPTYSVAGAFTDKNIGSNISVNCSNITLTGIYNNNYSLSTNNLTSTASISPYTPTIVLAPKNKEEALYTGEPIYANPAIITLVNGEKYNGDVIYTYYSDKSCSSDATTDAPKEIGTYYVKASMLAFGNYTDASSSCVKHKIYSKDDQSDDDTDNEDNDNNNNNSEDEKNNQDNNKDKDDIDNPNTGIFKALSILVIGDVLAIIIYRLVIKKGKFKKI